MPKHVLVARQDNMGDVLLSGPAVRAIAAGASRVTYLAGPHGAAAARMLPGVDEVVTRAAQWIDPDPEPLTATWVEQTVALVKSLDVEEAVIFTSFHQSPLPLALLLKMAGVQRVGAISTDYPGSLLDVRHVVDDNLHEVERALSLAARMGYALPVGDTGALQVKEAGPFDGSRSGDAATIHLPPAGTYVAVHPGASVPARAWGANQMRALVGALVARGVRVVVTGSSADSELCAFVADCSSELPADVVDLSGRTDLAGLATVLQGASVLVSGNTGPAHLAAAVGTPVVSLYAPTVPASRWRPWKVPHILLGDQDIGCAGCRARTCPVEGHPCVESVPASAVIEAVQRLAGDRAMAETATPAPWAAHETIEATL